MKLPGRLYDTKERQFIALYSYFPDVYIASLSSFEKRAKRVAHAAYSEGGKRRGIDVFLLNERVEDLYPVKKSFRGKKRTVYNSFKVPEMDFGKTRFVNSDENNERIDAKQDIEYDFVNMPLDMIELVIDSIRADVKHYCKVEAKDRGNEGKRVRIHDSLIPKTEVKYATPKLLVVPGKKEFVPGCKLEANIDSGNGCIAGWLPASDGQVASFDGKVFTNFYLALKAECDYCYAIPKHKTFPKTLFNIEKEILREQLLGKTRLKTGSEKEHGKAIKILRLGKRTEFGSIYTLNSLSLVLETCIETETRTVFPTKFLKYNENIAELLKRSNSSLYYSIGFDDVEYGPLMHGCDNNFRLEQMVKYAESGVNTNLYLLVADGSISPTGRDLKMIDFVKKHDKIRGLQVLPVRYSGKDLCKRMTGRIWDDLVKPTNVDEQFMIDGSFDENQKGAGWKVHAGTLIQNKLHDDWIKIVKDNNGLIRMCHHTEGKEGKTWCGTCNTGKGFIMPTISVVRNTFRKGYKNGNEGKGGLFF